MPRSITERDGRAALDTIRERLAQLATPDTGPLLKLAQLDAERLATRGDWAALVCKAERAHVVRRCADGLQCERCGRLVRPDHSVEEPAPEQSGAVVISLEEWRRARARTISSAP